MFIQCNAILHATLEAIKCQSGGSFLLQIDLYDAYILCRKFHASIKKCIKKCLGVLELYYTESTDFIPYSGLFSLVVNFPKFH